MTATLTPNLENSSSRLAQARALESPTTEAILKRDISVSDFWSKNTDLLVDAWREWDSQQVGLAKLDESLLDAKLRLAVETAWQDPSSESGVRELWQEVSPGVLQCAFFDPSRLADLRDYLDRVSEAKIPLRAPYGIALNRFGAMLDERSQGYLAAPSFQPFYRLLLERYMRPIARLLFPEVLAYDSQTFGFSIQYQAGQDTSLQLHSDASAATLNININLPGENFTGSEVDFYDPYTGHVNRIVFTPGTALIHRGSIAHAARPIISGKRSNLVLWLYGERMQVPPHPTTDHSGANNARQRWALSTVEKDKFAPF